MSAPGVHGPGIGLAALYERLEEARRFYRAERERIERRIAEREREREIDALLLACTPWKLPRWGRL